jgi:hypothetical protein
MVEREYYGKGQPEENDKKHSTLWMRIKEHLARLFNEEKKQEAAKVQKQAAEKY